MARALLDSPVGLLAVTVEEGAVSALCWCREGEGVAQGGDPVLTEALRQLDAFFAGTLRQFDLPLRPAASAFQQRFHDALCAIPFGQIRHYGDLARELGVSAQAIGQACGANPVPIIIPCHRVLAACGLGGYSGGGGIESKVTLLRLEGAASLLI